MKLSSRLKAIVSLIPEQSVLVDVGTDHGFLPAYCLLEKRCKYAYALDVAEKPLQQARKTRERYQLQKVMSVRHGDGLAGFFDEANCFVIAGLGAETIWSILVSFQFKQDDTIILQANTKVFWLRQALFENYFTVVDEVFLYDRKKPVFIMVVKPVTVLVPFVAADIYLGNVLKHSVSKQYHHYLRERLDYLETIKENNRDLSEEYHIIQNVLEGGDAQ